MAGPWEKYADPAAPTTGPWEKYAQNSSEAAGRPAPEENPRDKVVNDFWKNDGYIPQAVDLGASYVKGRTFGFGPKIAAGVGAGIAEPVLMGVEAMGGPKAPPISDLYAKGVDMYSAPAKRAEQNTPLLSLGAELAGGLKTGKGFGDLLKIPDVVAGAPDAASTLASELVGGVRNAAKVAGDLTNKNLATKIVGGAVGSDAVNRIYKTGEAAPGQEGAALTNTDPTAAAIGAVLPVAGGALSRIVSPQTSANVKKLMDENVRMTPGELVSGPGKIFGNMIKATEDKATAIPLLGDAVIAGKKRGVNDLNAAALNRALEPLDQTLPKGLVGEDARLHVKKALDDAYDATLTKLSVKPDPIFATDFLKTTQDAQTNLFGKTNKIFNAFVKNNITPRLGGKSVISGDDIKDIQRLIKNKIGTLNSAKTSDPNNEDMANILGNMNQAFNGLIARNNPEAAAQLSKIDQGFANYATIRQAAKSVGKTTEGSLTPAQLDSAVKFADKSAGKGRFGTGKAMMQDLTTPGKRVLSSSVGDSGTSPRQQLADLVKKTVGYAGGAAAAAGTATGALNPIAPLGAGALAAMYTPTGQKAMETLLARRPENAKRLADFLVKKSSSPVFAGTLADHLQGGN